MKRAAHFTAVAIFPSFLAGCVAPLIFGVAAAWTALTAVQIVNLTSGGKFEVRLAEEGKGAVVDRENLKKIKILAVFPGSTLSTPLADRLERENRFSKVITPMGIQATKEGHQYLLNAGQMTANELLSAQLKIARQVGAYGFLRFSETSGTFNMNAWTARSTQTTKFLLEIVESPSGKTLLSLPGEAILSGSSSVPPQEEINEIMVSTLTKKLYEFCGR